METVLFSPHVQHGMLDIDACCGEADKSGIILYYGV